MFTWELMESPFWLGTVGSAALFPAFVLSPYTGAIADKYGMRCVSYLALLAGSAAALGMGVHVTAGGTDIGPLFSLAVLQGITLAFDLPARQGLVPSLVARENMSSAIALNTTTFYLGAFVGPALFGLLVAFTELYYAFFINAVTFLSANTEAVGQRQEKGGATQYYLGSSRWHCLYLASSWETVAVRHGILAASLRSPLY